MERYYSVHIIRDAECTAVHGDAIGVYRTIEEAKQAAAEANYVYGAAIRDSETGALDFGYGFGVKVPVVPDEAFDERGYCAYTVFDSDSGERFSTTDYSNPGGYERALRRRNELALTYGKQHCLTVAGIDERGTLHEVTAE
jgi:hypothetical protein